MTVERWIASPEALGALGARLSRSLAVGDAVCLWGPLGAGKSTLARGLIRALTRPDEEAPSPTFTLVQTYDGPQFPVAHFDLYRLTRPEDLDELGLEDALESGAVVIEWPQRLDGALPANRLDVVLRFPRPSEPEGRGVRITGHGTWSGRIDFD